jgi:hypothetical protein
MGDDDILKLLGDLSHSEHALPLNDSVVDAFLATPTKCTDGAVDRMRTRFVERVLNDVHTKLVRDVDDQPLGRWLEATRKKARLTLRDIGTAIGKDQICIERLEGSTIMPWALPPLDLAKLIQLFRIHMSAFTKLVAGSYSLSRTQTQLGGDVIGRAHGGKASPERGDALKRSLDLFLTKNARKADLSPEIASWLEDVQLILKEQGAKEFLE